MNGLGGSGHALALPTANSIMLPNEEFALACREWYAEQGLIVDETNGEFAHSPLTRKECDTGYYLLHGHHQHQGLLQSKDLGKCCFFPYHTLAWLKDCNYFPENYFDLWDIYDKYASEHGKENGGKAGKKTHEEKDENGKSKNAVKNGKKIMEEKDENGKSKHAVIMGKKTHEKKDENGKSLFNVKLHEEKDELGRSLIGLKSAEKVHKEKDENGKSKHAIRMGQKGGRKGARNTNNQVWESLIDGYQNNAGAVAMHNKANGWDPNARIRVG